MERDDADYKRPPVQRVRLAYSLVDRGPISPMDLDGLRSLWRSEYPVVTQLAPLPSDDDDKGPLELQSGSSSWPLPFLVFEGEGHGRRIMLQNDRFALEWAFGTEEYKYPSYELLREEFSSRYKEFRDCLSGNGVENLPLVTQVDMFYVNKLEEAFRSYLTSVFFGLAGPPQEEDGAQEYFSRHYHWRGGNPCWVTINSSEAGTQLRIRATFDPPEPTFEALDALDMCHEEISIAFARHTTDEMRNRWI